MLCFLKCLKNCHFIFICLGAYLLNIQWSDRQVRGSPFKVNVVAASDASKVVCTGEGLKVGIMGKEIKSVIDTRRAGPGMQNSLWWEKIKFLRDFSEISLRATLFA